MANQFTRSAVDGETYTGAEKMMTICASQYEANYDQNDNSEYDNMGVHWTSRGEDGNTIYPRCVYGLDLLDVYQQYSAGVFLALMS
jgi:hypothetical protein